MQRSLAMSDALPIHSSIESEHPIYIPKNHRFAVKIAETRYTGSIYSLVDFKNEFHECKYVKIDMLSSF